MAFWNLKIYPQRQTSSNEATCPLTRPQPVILSTQCTNLEPDNQIYEKAGGWGGILIQAHACNPSGKRIRNSRSCWDSRNPVFKTKNKNRMSIKEIHTPFFLEVVWGDLGKRFSTLLVPKAYKSIQTKRFKSTCPLWERLRSCPCCPLWYA